MSKKKIICAVILAAGESKRFGKNKLFAEFAGKTVLEIVLHKFETNPDVHEIILVTSKKSLRRIKTLCSGKYSKLAKIVYGGRSRQQSSALGVDAVKNADKILIHDADRPFVSQKLISKSIVECKQALIVALPVEERVKHVSKTMKTIDRRKVFIAQTPQIFDADLIRLAHKMAKKKKIKADDDSSLVEVLGDKVKMISGERSNIKITYPGDIK